MSDVAVGLPLWPYAILSFISYDDIPLVDTVVVANGKWAVTGEGE